MPDTGRRVVLDGAVNFRDVGGLPLRDGGTVRSGQVFRSDSLHALSSRDLEHLHDVLGLATVVDLRMDDEVAEHCPPEGAFREGVRLLRLPFFTTFRDEWREPMAWATEDLRAERYYEFAVSGAPSMVELVRAAGEPGGLPLVVHCQVGRDRTGVAIGILLDLLGVDRAAIGEDYAVSARYITDFELSPERILLMLDLIAERHGSVAGLLREHGAADEELSRLRAALLA